ncbi:MAG: hypothetical protein K9L62_16190 [Vallitaleaceae bacterium]|nr:hypothetical protein [Vallitaleaceae bacterium]
MRINNNLMAMNTHRQLGMGQTAGAKSMEKLSSGFRINRAGDDAAGLSISEKMRGQIRGLNQASRNAQDGISLIQTAEGALNETQNILQRMRELSVQASNDTLVSADRNEIQKEMSQLNSEIDRISDTTEFNTQKLLNGSLGAVGTSDTPGNVVLVSASGLKVGDHDVVIDTAASKAVLTGAGNATDAALAGGEDITINGFAVDTTGVTTVAGLVSAINDISEDTGFTVSGSDGAPLVFTATEFGSGKSISIGGADVADTGVGAAALVDGADAVISITNGSETNQVTGVGQDVTFQGAEFTAVGAATSTATITVTSAGASLHIGANTDQTMSVDVSEISTSTLGNTTNKIKDVSVATAASAEIAITTINDAITQVSSERSKLGAFQNRLEHSIKNLDTSSENLQASESRIRDVDMAKEMMEFTKNNILTQAAQAMLAQANNAPQGVLQLLR